MQRRSFLLAAGSGMALAATGMATMAWRWQEITAQAHYPGRAAGHVLRTPQTLPAPVARYDTDVVVLGSGIAGLTAAWKMHKEGHADYLLIDGPEPDGNAAGGRHGELAYPTGAHYLPLPSVDSFHVREVLHDLGILLRDPYGEKPYYDERFLLHAPHERLLIGGAWQEVLIPVEGVGAGELAQQQRFFGELERMRAARGSDGRRPFVFPAALSSNDPHWTQLDQLSFKTWMARNGYDAPSLQWYADYACRDDFGTGYDKVSAWAGLHYFCSRNGEAANAAAGAWLTWPGGLQVVADGLARRAEQRRRSGTAASLRQVAGGVEALCFMHVEGRLQTYTVRARKAICAMPLHVASHVVENIRQYGFDKALDLPDYAPWMVANFLMRRFPEELPEAPLCWDNVIHRNTATDPGAAGGLGYVLSTHQDIRSAPPERTVFTSYVAMSHRSAAAARAWLDTASVEALLDLASADLKAAYGWKFAQCVERVDITVRGHAMAVPSPGFRSNRGRIALREQDGAILFAHADLSGFSVFEEASWWGYRAAQRAIA